MERRYVIHYRPGDTSPPMTLSEVVFAIERRTRQPYPTVKATLDTLSPLVTSVPFRDDTGRVVLTVRIER